jgi:hypothetical protein
VNYHVVLLLAEQPTETDSGWTYTADSPPREGDEIEVTKANGRARARVASWLDARKLSAVELERLA